MIEPVPPPAPVPNPFTLGQCLQFAIDEVQRGAECRAKHKALSDWVTEK